MTSADLSAGGKNVGFTGLTVAYSHDSVEQTSLFSHSIL